MALFNRKKSAEVGSSSGGNMANTASVQKAAKPVAKEPAQKAPAPVSETRGRTDLAHILEHARITEKASMLQGKNVYAFDISERATKRDVMLAVKSLYDVSPRKVAVVNVRSKNTRNMRTGRSGVKRGGKKAYVFLKSGETINIA
jgi:ribosomal protein L23